MLKFSMEKCFNKNGFCRWAHGDRLSAWVHGKYGMWQLATRSMMVQYLRVILTLTENVFIKFCGFSYIKAIKQQKRYWKQSFVLFCEKLILA